MAGPITVPLTVSWAGHFVMEQGLVRRLVKDAQAGDEASFERIVILHERLVLRVAQRLLLNREDAKDAAQEVFIRLHRTLGRFDEEKDLGPWLYRLTVNICRDHWRRSKRDVPIETAQDWPDTTPDPETSAISVQSTGWCWLRSGNCRRANVKSLFCAIWKGDQPARSPGSLGHRKRRFDRSFQPRA